MLRAGLTTLLTARPKRVNFISIQASHVVATKDSDCLPIRTGYESVIPHRVDDLFAYSAKGAGTITAKTPRSITIKYDDPSLGERHIELGRRFGVVTGHTVPHEIVTGLNVGDKVADGQVVTYHKGFFKPDWRDPTQMATSPGPLANIVLMENNNTFEDASLISRKFSQRLTTDVTHTRTLLVKFDEGIRDLVTEGTHLSNDDILAYIEDQTSALTGNFDSDSLETLRRLGSPAPRSKFLGDVERIEVFYFGDKEDMSSSVRAVADKYDSQRAKRVKALGTGEALTGRIMTPTRVDGLELEMDQMAIRIYITHSRGMGDGDKLVVGNQKKSVVSGVFDGVFRTNDEVIPGQGKMDIDMQFSYRAINARIVPSALLFGMSSILVAAIEQKMVDMYDSE